MFNLTRLGAFVKYNASPFSPQLLMRHSLKRGLAKFCGLHGMRAMDIAVTYRCNLNCQHCSAAVFDGSGRRELSIYDIETLAENAIAMDFLSINLTGGEPLIRDDIYEIIKLFDRKKLYVVMQSNLLLLTQDIAKHLRDCGLSGITTSLDSHIANIHNKFRGNDHAFEKTCRAVTLAKEAGMSVLIGGTVTPQNLRSGELEQLIKKVNSLGAIFLFNLAVPCGNWAGNKEICLSSEDREILTGLLQKYPLSSTDHEPGRNAKGCPAGAEKIYITAYGDVIPCPFIHVSFGNIRDMALPEIVYTMRCSRYFSQYQPICIAAEDKKLHEEIFASLQNKSLPARWNTIGALRNEIRPKLNKNPASSAIRKEKCKCIICNHDSGTIAAQGKDFIYNSSDGIYSVTRCEYCGHLYLNPRPQTSEAAKIYPGNYYTLDDSFVKKGLVSHFKDKVLLNRLSFFDFKDNASVLDVGSGDCGLLCAIKKNYPDVKCTGIDMAFSASVKHKCAALGIDLIESLIEEMPPTHTGLYDLIIMNQIIEHLWDPEAVLKKLYSYMNQGAYLSISTVNVDGYDRKKFKPGLWGGYYFPRHFNLFSTDMLKKFVTSCGFKVIKQDSLVAPIIWNHSFTALYQDKKANKFLRKFIMESNAVSLTVFTLLDSLAKICGKTTSNQQLIACKCEVII